jgi:hypothetical protein
MNCIISIIKIIKKLIFLGPLAVVDQNRVVLVGVLCFIHKCGDPVVPTVSIRVSTIKDWILANSDAGQWQCDP